MDPTEEEEFELMYGDDLELARTQAFEDFSSEPQPSTSNAFEQTQPIENRKRSINELFGDITDIDDVPIREEEVLLPILKKFKPQTEDNVEKLALIEHILELRREAKNNLNNLGTTHNFKKFQESLRDKISIRIPQYPFIAVTNNTGDRLYVRAHSEEYWEEDVKSVHKRLNHADFGSTLGINFDDIWHKAEELRNKKAENADLEVFEPVAQEDNNLWVEVYKPKKYIDLLSDESTNRTLLRWLKLWDRVVFGTRAKINMAKMNAFQKNVFEVEDDHRPKYKIALLAGPPGLGKTTLAHLVALHAGYKPMEINASDDRTPDAFKRILDNGTTMTSVLDSEKRPNCIIFDEIDGAPTNAIDFLCKYVQGSVKVKSKKGGVDGKKDLRKILKRPIIAICNDAYAPALRGLRQLAMVLHVPPITSSRLTDRLVSICSNEHIIANRQTLSALSEKSNCDVRNCLSLLQFFKARSSFKSINNNACKLTLEQVLQTNHSKDIYKGLFEIWSDIFYLKRNTDNSLPTIPQRCQKIQSIINSYDVEKLAVGVFENYVRLNTVKDNLNIIAAALDWFAWMDIMHRKMLQEQNYQLGTYLSWAFVQWHLAFANLPNKTANFIKKPQGVKQMSKVFGSAGKYAEQFSDDGTKVVFPTVTSDVRQQAQKTDAIMTELLKCMSPQVRVYYTKNSLKLDVLPILKYIINPALRPVNLHLYTPSEKQELAQVVSIMIDYGLNYVQERSQEGNYAFNLDPNVNELTTFANVRTKYGRSLSYSNRQLVAREIEIEKMRRLEITKNRNATESQIEAAKKSKLEPNKGKSDGKHLPNHLAKLTPKNVNTVQEQKSKNFFSFMKKSNSDPSESGDATNGKVGVSEIYFKFKEGYTNAVKKKVKISELL